MPGDARDLLEFLAASPSPHHCVAESQRRLLAAGFVEIDESAEPVTVQPGQGAFVSRGASIIAWRGGLDAPAAAGFRVLGAHTDSPNLRLKSRPDSASEGYRRLGVEVYGGVLLSTWMDRDLGLSGRVALRGKDGLESRLIRYDRPFAHIPNLAIHLNRTVNTDGLKLDPQRHLPAIIGRGEGRGLRALLADELGVDADALLGWELGLHDLAAPCLGGLDDEFLFSARLDNQYSCYCALSALIAASAGRATQVIALFDHEEVGSRSYRGANGPFLRDILTRLVRDHREQRPGGLERAAVNSLIVSADMAHGVHPNYADLHEPAHKPMLNGGPVLKMHNEQRYATDEHSAAIFRLGAAELGLPCQEFMTRSDLACGTTIGPISAAELGIRTVDVGCAMWSMHSIRETAGSQDAAMMSDLMRHLLERS